MKFIHKGDFRYYTSYAISRILYNYAENYFVTVLTSTILDWSWITEYKDIEPLNFTWKVRKHSSTDHVGLFDIMNG